MKEHASPKQVARALGVSEASVKRWCDKGLLSFHRTAGGHRRIPLPAVVGFLRDSGRTLIQPEVIGLPATAGRTDVVLDRAAPLLHEALLAGDEQRCRVLLLDLYVAGHDVPAICDRVVAPAFSDVGRDWESGACEVYQERRACEISVRALHYLGAAVTQASPGSPLAIGGSLEGDWYIQPSIMAELTLREIGWRATSVGPGVPSASLAKAITDARPRLFWLSVSAHLPEDQVLADSELIASAAEPIGTAVVVGGRALSPKLRQHMRYAAHCDTMRHLAAFGRALLDPGLEQNAPSFP